VDPTKVSENSQNTNNLKKFGLVKVDSLLEISVTKRVCINSRNSGFECEHKLFQMKV